MGPIRYAGSRREGLGTLIECIRRLPSADELIDYRIWLHTDKVLLLGRRRDARDLGWRRRRIDGGRWVPHTILADAHISMAGRSRGCARLCIILGEDIDAARDVERGARSGVARDSERRLSRRRICRSDSIGSPRTIHSRFARPSRGSAGRAFRQHCARPRARRSRNS